MDPARSRGFATILLSLLLFLPVAPACAGEARTLPGKVVSVTDGDTLKVEVREGDRPRVLKVRLLNVDSPEEGQNHYRQARLFASELAHGKPVSLRLTGGKTYDRVVGEVRLPDGRDLGREMVRGGFAWAGYSPASRRGKGVTPLLSLETEARRARRGLWAEDDPLPPWEFRASRR